MRQKKLIKELIGIDLMPYQEEMLEFLSDEKNKIILTWPRKGMDYKGKLEILEFFKKHEKI